MTDFEAELLADLNSSDDDIEQEDVVPQENQDNNTLSFHEKLQHLILSNATADSFQTILSQPDIETISDLTSLSKIHPLIPELKEKILQYSNEEETDYLELLSSINDDVDQSEEYKFIILINELSTIINNEILVFYSLVKMQYKDVFPELESLIPNAIDYVRIINIIKQDLTNIKSYEQEMKSIVSNEKVLVIIMAGLQQVQNQVRLSDEEMDKIASCLNLILELNDILQDLSQFISNKLSKFAPNVSAIIGPITTSQLLIATGSLKQLALTPSCNVASLGVRDLSTSTKTKSKNIQQTGYVYHSDLVKYLPPEIIRSVMRIISGKIILAARIDLSKSSPDGELGRKYLEEIQGKIDKLLTPPEQTPDKALPAPTEQKSKKRGGRKVRKYKERFQMSELRKAQNKMEFGKQEDTIMDGFGEEIGLGMSGSGSSSGRIGQILVNTKTNAKMSKGMIKKLQSQQKQEEEKLKNPKTIFDEDLDSLILTKPKSATKLPASLTNSIKSKWLSGINKRKIGGEEYNGEVSKKPKLQ
ncbi:U4/U6 small nuclear ribonucleoprotein Prp31 [Candida viswanathii]|uniref:U4/U6 small nuclear ribonucleoprotein Prp31 n=1 Tax=Candida viswanathii TaxID=5486 RepID=A0A367YQ44_9ASCO|nr:U4/U6 small nuclear ribonucleoprotein Prp31 [Candida viswanathii]